MAGPFTFGDLVENPELIFKAVENCFPGANQEALAAVRNTDRITDSLETAKKIVTEDKELHDEVVIGAGEGQLQQFVNFGLGELSNHISTDDQHNTSLYPQFAEFLFVRVLSRLVATAFKNSLERGMAPATMDAKLALERWRAAHAIAVDEVEGLVDLEPQIHFVNPKGEKILQQLLDTIDFFRRFLPPGFLGTEKD